MEIKVYNNINRIRREFIELSKNSRPLQKFSVVKNIFSFLYYIEPFFYDYKKFRSFNFYVVYDKNIPILIVPATANKEELFIMGGKEWDYVDLIYSTNDFELLKKAFSEVLTFLKKQGIKKIHWFYLGEDSVFYRILKDLNGFSIKTDFIQEKNVNIPFASYHVDYFNSLKKSVRQNCRTAYNRLARDGKKYELKIFFAPKNKPLKSDRKAKKAFNECMKIYLNRQMKRYKTPKKYILRIKYYDYFTRSVTDENGFISMLLVDNKIAAFMMGLSDLKRESIIIPRIAIDDEYNFYSPGLLLIDQTIKYLSENTPYRDLDLCDGDEKYKYDMGGIDYFTYKMHIDII